MSGNCPTLALADGGIASELVGAIDCFVRGDAAAGYARFAGPGSPFAVLLATALTLYVAFVGYRLILGHADLGLRALAPRLFLLGGILALTTQWSAYQTLVYDVLTDGPEQVAAWVHGDAGQARDAMARVDAVAGRLLDMADGWSNATQAAALDRGEDGIPATADGKGRQAGSETASGGEDAPSASPTGATPPFLLALPRGSLGPDILLLSALLLLLASAGVLAVAKVLLALLLGVGPLFIAAALFDATRGLAVGWARAAVSLALVPLFALLITVASLAFLEPMTVQMAAEAAGDTFSLRSATAVLVTVLVTVAVSFQTFRLSQQMIGTWDFLKPREAGPIRDADDAPVVVPLAPVLPALPNERIHTLVTDMERSVNVTASLSATSPRLLAGTGPAPVAGSGGAGGDAPPARRGLDGGRTGSPRGGAARAPLRAVRSGQ